MEEPATVETKLSPDAGIEPGDVEGQPDKSEDEKNAGQLEEEGICKIDTENNDHEDVGINKRVTTISFRDMAVTFIFRLGVFLHALFGLASVLDSMELGFSIGDVLLWLLSATGTHALYNRKARWMVGVGIVELGLAIYGEAVVFAVLAVSNLIGCLLLWNKYVLTTRYLQELSRDDKRLNCAFRTFVVLSLCWSGLSNCMGGHASITTEYLPFHPPTLSQSRVTTITTTIPLLNSARLRSFRTNGRISYHRSMKKHQIQGEVVTTNGRRLGSLELVQAGHDPIEKFPRVGTFQFCDRYDYRTSFMLEFQLAGDGFFKVRGEQNTGGRYPSEVLRRTMTGNATLSQDINTYNIILDWQTMMTTADYSSSHHGSGQQQESKQIKTLTESSTKVA